MLSIFKHDYQTHLHWSAVKLDLYGLKFFYHCASKSGVTVSQPQRWTERQSYRHDAIGSRWRADHPAQSHRDLRDKKRLRRIVFVIMPHAGLCRTVSSAFARVRFSWDLPDKLSRVYSA